MRRRVVLLTVVAACGSPAASDSDWVAVASMEVPRSEMPAVVIDGDIYVIGGLVDGLLGDSVTDSVERYRPDEDRWERMPALPEPRHHAMAVEWRGSLVVIGGYGPEGFTPTDSVWGFDAGSGRWNSLPSLPAPTGAGAAVSIEGVVYVAGGTPDGDRLWSFDGSGWREMTEMSTPRQHLAAVVQGGQMWVLGGRWEGEMLDSVEVFDPVTETWAGEQPMLEARSGFGAAVVGDEVVVAGGEVFGPTRVLASVERLASTGWINVSPLPAGLHGVPLAASDGVLFVLSGSRTAGAVDNTGEVFLLRG